MTLSDNDLLQVGHLLWEKRDNLPMFVVTDHPSDWPDFYVARLHFTLGERGPTNLVLMDRSLESLRDTMRALLLSQLTRDPNDDPAIMEVWL
jgi:hypothetical protein